MIDVVAKAVSLKSSPRKLNSVASLVRGTSAKVAINKLQFCSRAKPALMIRKVIFSALANAQNNFGINVDNVFISSIFVDKSSVIRRFRPRSRGRSNRICKFYSTVKVVLREY